MKLIEIWMWQVWLVGRYDDARFFSPETGPEVSLLSFSEAILFVNEICCRRCEKTPCSSGCCAHNSSCLEQRVTNNAKVGTLFKGSKRERIRHTGTRDTLPDPVLLEKERAGLPQEKIRPVLEAARGMDERCNLQEQELKSLAKDALSLTLRQLGRQAHSADDAGSGQKPARRKVPRQGPGAHLHSGPDPANLACATNHAS